MSLGDYIRDSQPWRRRIADVLDAHRGSAWGGQTTGTNTISATLQVPISRVLDGFEVRVRWLNTNTGACTFAITNNIAAKAIKRKDGTTALSAGDLVSGEPGRLQYDVGADVWRWLGV